MNDYSRTMLPYQLRPLRDERGDNTIDLETPLKEERSENTVDVAKAIATLMEYRWMILGVALLAALLGAAYAFIARPMYEANILIQVDDTPPQGGRSILTDLPGVFDRKAGVATEMEILRSRNVLSRVIDSTHAYISVRPKYFPVIGSWIAGLGKNVSTPGLAGLNLFRGYVWGAERATVSLFNVPDALKGKTFILTAQGNNRYRVQQPDQGIDFTAALGQTIHFPSMAGDMELRVDRMIAKPGAQFLLTRNFDVEAIEGLEKSLKIAEQGKQSNIINVRLAGPDPREISNVVNEVGREYIRQTFDQKAEEAEKSLTFLNKQLPILKQELENAEAKYNKIRNTYSTVDLGEESKVIVQQAATLQTKLLELRQKRQELQTRYEDAHPAMQMIIAQIRQVEAEIDAINAKIKRMPSIEQEVLRATRDVKVNTELYTNLLSTAQQLRQVSASRLGGARLLDTAAVPVKPNSPNRKAIISFAALLGLALGAVTALARKKLRGELPDPYTLANQLRVPVSATIPHSVEQERLYRQILDKTGQTSLLPYVAPADGAVESLRGFRTLLQPAMRYASNNIILITGPTPDVGKSFVSANFAVVLASIDKKVLLIDGDMRKGHLHRYFGLERKNGLSELLSGQAMPEDAVHREVAENVDFISTGTLPRQPAELLAHPNFTQLLQAMSPRYDFILIDTAPVLAFTDASIIATHAGAIYNVVRDGVSTPDEIQETVRRLVQTGNRVTGTVFNDLKGKSAYLYGYGPRTGNRYGR